LASPHITSQGYSDLEKELQSLWKRRADVTVALTAAAAEGDRSENAEYIYRKKELRELDRRIRYLQKRLPNLKVVREVADHDRVFFGAWVRLEREDGIEVEYRIVGSDETDASRGYISIDSPMARALMKKRKDDEIFLQLADRSETFVLVGIRYDEPSPTERKSGL
jgi:transcription elongation factor GreB